MQKFLKPLAGLFLLGLLACDGQESKNTTQQNPQEPTFQALSLLGDSLYSAAPSAIALEKLAAKREAYAADASLDNLIWVGRFIAYTGSYREAIDWYTEGIIQYPEESRLYRHRGHRYLSVREYEKAIADLERAATLMAGAPNSIEPDGAPNPQGIPVSTRHGNVWYHLGLAYYLTGQYDKALTAYQNCLHIALSNDDNLVSATHWLTLILGRLDRTEESIPYLTAITDSLSVIENHSYWRTCQYYKGELPADSLVQGESVTPATVAQAYGVAAYTLQQTGPEAARPYYEAILNTDSWASFGYLAAEADWKRYYP